MPRILARTIFTRTLFAALAVALGAFLASLAAAPDTRADTSASDRAAIRAVVEGQIEAFRADDGVRAYGYAAPGIKRLFPSVEGFMAMVRNGYPPVYRPRDVVFGALRETPHGPVQEVFLTDEAGIAWSAMYSLERQPDGAWLINGCWLVRTGVSA